VKKGCGPARHQHILHLQLSGGIAHAEKLLADRSTNPNVQDVSCEFQAWRFQQHGSDHGADMFDCVKEVAAYNKAHDGGRRAAVQWFIGKNDSDDGRALILAICSSLYIVPTSILDNLLNWFSWMLLLALIDLVAPRTYLVLDQLLELFP